MNPKLSNVVSVYKPIGMSPVQLINKFKEKYPKYKDEKISYAGRLDPLAHGVMVLLIGDENKKRREYEKNDKEYQFKAVLGFSTDSYDICGLATKVDEFKVISTKEITKAFEAFKGKSIQKFPPFSSYIIKGKPLFKWARDNKLEEIKVPEKEIFIYNIHLITLEIITGRDLLNIIENSIKTLNGDFRQEEILKIWKENISENDIYQILHGDASVSAGTYIRGIVDELGKRLEYKATVLEIYRSKSGKYGIEEALRL